mmetsp:Transcript_41346/g.88820  ORF Transcript_41346/g.88820 Transcript_41346/m.88820 type:complete len:249 (-) Transcript_41346:426-1172(-)
MPSSLAHSTLPSVASGLGPLYYLRDNTASIVTLASTTDGGVLVLAEAVRARLVVAGLDDADGGLLKQGLLGGLELASWIPNDDFVADVDNLIQEEVVKDTVRAHQHYVALIDGDAMQSTTMFDNLEGYPLVEVRIDAVVDARDLKRTLRVALNSLHLCVKDGLQPGNRVVHVARTPPKNQDLAITHGEHGQHRMRLAMDGGVVVQDSQKSGRGPQSLRVQECLLHQSCRAGVGALFHLHPVRNQLLYR